MHPVMRQWVTSQTKQQWVNQTKKSMFTGTVFLYFILHSLFYTQPVGQQYSSRRKLCTVTHLIVGWPNLFCSFGETTLKLTGGTPEWIFQNS